MLISSGNYETPQNNVDFRQNHDWEETKKTYVATLTSSSKIRTTKTLFTHLEAFLMENNLTFKDLPDNLDGLKVYLQNKVSKKSFYT